MIELVMHITKVLGYAGLGLFTGAALLFGLLNLEFVRRLLGR